MAKHTSVTKSSLKIPGDWTEINGNNVLLGCRLRITAPVEQKEQDRLVLDPAGKELLVSAVKSWGILRVSLDVNCCLAYGGNRRSNTEVGLFQISKL